MLIKRKNSENWYVKFSIGGKTIYKSTGTADKTKAEEIALRVHSEAFDQIKLGAKPRYVWQDAVVRWITESEKKSIETDKHHLRWLAPHLDNVALCDIDTDRIERIIKAKQATGVTNTRVNRTTELIRAILNKAHKEWRWVDSTPFIRRFKEPAGSPRWITKDEARRLLEELPEHTRAMMIFTLATGLRQANVTGLEWRNVDLASRLCWVEPDNSKNGKLLRVELNDDALAILKEQRFKHQARVFVYKGGPITNVSTKAWYAALNRAGIDNFRWHDLRHTWASWHVQAGTPLEVLKDLGHWSSYEMVLRYAHLAPQHLAHHTKNVAGFLKQDNKIVAVAKT